jgi:oligopeptide/dipeptide ABC transporter ATP-binding protein
MACVTHLTQDPKIKKFGVPYMTTNLLEVNNLKTYFYTRGGVVKAVDDVSFSIAAGETLGIVGESGSGKSVTALSIMRLIATPPGKIVGGEISFNNENILEKNMDELTELRGSKISMIFQDPMTSLNPVFTVGFQIAETVKRHRKGVSNDQAWKRAVEMLDLVRIPDAQRRAKNHPHEFSGGMRQRVMIAIALACNPQLLIADEPTTALDVTIQAQVLELMKGLSQEFGTAVMLITHDLGVVAGTCQRVNVMYAGHIVEASTVKQIFEAPAHPYTLGLLQSIPRVDDTKGTRLTPIPGQPPDMINPPSGCPYNTRCPKVQARCHQERPELMPVGRGEQLAACFYPN